MIRIVMVLLLSALALPGLAQTPDKLGPGDAVHVTVFQQPDLTTDARINETGSIAMPLVGAVKISGLSTSDAANRTAHSIQRIGQPEVGDGTMSRGRVLRGSRCLSSGVSAETALRP